MILNINWLEIWDYTRNVLVFLYVISIILSIISIVLDNRNPTKTLSWILALTSIPLLGLIIFILVGRNHRKRKIFSRKGLGDMKWLELMNKHHELHLSEEFNIKDKKIIEKKHLMTLLHNNSKSILTKYNDISILKDGEQTFNEIFKSLKKAKDHIHIEYYIIEEGELASELKDILILKAREGVEIRIIYDALGSWQLSKKYINELSQEGIKIQCFQPVHFPLLTNHINYRNHRKIIVIDGETAFVGGLNFADRYLNGIQGIGKWRDTHIKIVGESASSLQIVFLIDWYFVRQEILFNTKYLPYKKADKECLTQISASGADSDWASIFQAYFSIITSAKEYVYISSPYFMPNNSILVALKTASMSGLDVRIMIPRKSDSFITFWCTNSYIEELLDAGIRIFKYKIGFNHSKIIMVDDIISTVGTANMDERSFEQNFEVNAIIYNEEITKQLKRDFIDDLESSEEITKTKWAQRDNISRIKESLTRLFAPIL